MTGTPLPAAGAQDAALTRARTLLALGRPQEALREASLTLAGEPDHLGLLHLAYAAHERLGQHRASLGLAERLLALQPESAPVRRMYAASRWNVGRRDRATLRAAEEALALDPDDPDSHNLLGFMRLSRGRLAPAREHFQAALALHPDDDTAAEAHARLGAVALRQRRPAEAEREARAALALDPAHEAGLRVLAAAQLRGPQPHEAIRTALASVQQEPTSEARAKYLRLIVGEYLPHPLGLQTWRFVFVPYGVGVLVSLGLALFLTLRNAARWAALPTDLRAVVRASRQAAGPGARWRPWLWLAYAALFVGGLALLPERSPALAWFFWLMVLAGLALWLLLRRWR